MVATAYKQLRTALGAGDENRRRTTKVETLQTAVQFIQDLNEELAGLQLLRNKSSDGVYPTEPLPTVQANLVRICARRCMLPRLLPRLLPFAIMRPSHWLLACFSIDSRVTVTLLSMVLASCLGTYEASLFLVCSFVKHTVLVIYTVVYTLCMQHSIMFPQLSLPHTYKPQGQADMAASYAPSSPIISLMCGESLEDGNQQESGLALY